MVIKNSKLFAISTLVLLAQAYSQETKKVVSYEELAHENLGCPENSVCTQEMGLKYKAFKAFLATLEEEIFISTPMEEYRLKNGLPVQFLAAEAAHKESQAILWNSPCPQHNGKPKVYLGMNFYMDNPNKPNIWFDPAIVYTAAGKKTYYLPFKDQPSYILEDKMVVVKEIEGAYYYLQISDAGTWGVVPKTKEIYSSSYEVTCPEDKTFELKKELYRTSFCKNVYDITNKKFQTVRLMWTCE